jgi:hypothetical protein
VPWKGARTPGGGAEVTGAACDEELAGTYVIRLAEPRRRPARRCACASPASHDLPKASAEARAERSRPSARSSSGVDVQRPARRGGDTCPSPLPRPRRARILATILVLLRVCTRLEIAGALAARVARRDGRLLAGQRPFIQACGSIPAAILPPPGPSISNGSREWPDTGADTLRSTRASAATDVLLTAEKLR